MENMLQTLSDTDLDAVTGGSTHVTIVGVAGVGFAIQNANTIKSSKGAGGTNEIVNTGISVTYVSLG